MVLFCQVCTFLVHACVCFFILQEDYEWYALAAFLASDFAQALTSPYYKFTISLRSVLCEFSILVLVFTCRMARDGHS